MVQACTFLLQKDLGPMTKIRSLTVFVLRLILVEQFFFMEHEFDMVPGKTATIQFGICNIIIFQFTRLFSTMVIKLKLK